MVIQRAEAYQTQLNQYAKLQADLREAIRKESEYERAIEQLETENAKLARDKKAGRE